MAESPEQEARKARSVRRPRGGLAAKLALALVVSLLASECTLQLAGLAARATTSRASHGSAGGDTLTVLCVGDSHTYGLPLPAEHSYPAQLEAALQARYPEREVRVVNLGIPSLNSSFVANRLPRQMLQLRPQLVIVWVGVNNRWNVVERSGEEAESRWEGLRRFLMVSRLFRLASIAWYTRTGHQYDPEQRGGWYEGELPPSGRAAEGRPKELADPFLARDLERMAETARSLETPILFASYPLQPDSGLNRTIRDAGRRLRVPVIDTAEDRMRAARDGHTADDLIDRSKGPHPTRLLYAYVVESMLPVVEAALASYHGIEPAVREP